jgi:hypothetical protein
MGGITVEPSSEESLDESLELSSEESLEESLELSSEESPDETSELSSEELSVVSELFSEESFELSMLSELSVWLLELVVSLNKSHAPNAKVNPKHKISINNFFIVFLLFYSSKGTRGNSLSS